MAVMVNEIRSWEEVAWSIVGYDLVPSFNLHQGREYPNLGGSGVPSIKGFSFECK